MNSDIDEKYPDNNEEEQSGIDGRNSELPPPITSSLKGLCINCENRETCILPKPAGGVWQCEEYS